MYILRPLLVLLTVVLSVVNSYCVYFSGRSAARLARLLWEQKVGGSNPLAPIKNKTHITQTPIAQLDRATDF